MDIQRSEIQSFYKDKIIFIIGATGFIGKVLVEKLLYSCSDLEKIYILSRAKKDCNFENRLSTMFDLPMFQRIQREKPEMLKKVIPLNGDVCLNNLGLTKEQREKLINEVNVVFNCAANVRMNSKLKDAIEINLIGTKRVLDLAKQMMHLQAFLHVSTAFCHVEQEELGERIFDSPHDPNDIIKLVQWMDEDSIDLITPKLLGPHPNTYTYSKCLAETLVANEYPYLPCCIARPSIVIPSYSEPIPGWIDNLNGPTGVLVGLGKGLIKSVNCNPNYHAELIPVDITSNAIIVMAYRIGTQQEEFNDIPVINLSRSFKSLKWGEVWDMFLHNIYKYPFEGQIWYPCGKLYANEFVHNLHAFFLHTIYAYIVDFLMLIFGRKRFMIAMSKQISSSLGVLRYFSTKKWLFHNTKLSTIHNEMSPEDKKMFFTTLGSNMNIMEYFNNYILGARQYSMKEHPSTLPKTRQRLKMLYVIHIATKCLFYLGTFKFLFATILRGQFAARITARRT